MWPPYADQKMGRRWLTLIQPRSNATAAEEMGHRGQHRQAAGVAVAARVTISGSYSAICGGDPPLPGSYLTIRRSSISRSSAANEPRMASALRNGLGVIG